MEIQIVRFDSVIAIVITFFKGSEKRNPTFLTSIQIKDQNYIQL